MKDKRTQILEFQRRRKARLAKRNYNDGMEVRADSIDLYIERRKKRLTKRGIDTNSIKTFKPIDKNDKMCYNNNGSKRNYDAAEVNGEKVQWKTADNGKHYAINEEGDVVAGPNALKGVNIAEKGGGKSSASEERKGSGSKTQEYSGKTQKKPYKPSATYEKYKSEAAKKISNVFPKDPGHSTGINYRGHEVELRLQSAEAQELFNTLQDKNKPNPTLSELKANPVVKQLDDISRKCTEALGGFTSDIHTPEREELRKEIGDRFLSLGSARIDPVTKKTVAFDGEVKREFQAVIYTGLPAVGKSTAVDPLSSEMGAFVFDNDTIKGMIPEFEATGGAAAGAVHEESSDIQKACLKEFLSGGSRNGDNIAYPTIGDKPEKILKIAKQFEEAGYTVKVRCLNAPAEMSAGRVVARAIETGRIIDSAVVLGYGDRPTTAYKALQEYDEKNGTKYADGISDAR